MKKMKNILITLLVFVLCISNNYSKYEIKAQSNDNYKIITHDFTLHTSEGYDYAMSFDALEITHPDLSKERKSYEEFIALGGHVETTVPKIQTPGRYETVYSLEGVSEVASILIIEDEIEVEYHLNDIAMFAHQPLNIEETFESVVVTVNGNTETYNTIQEFVDAGGTIDFGRVPTPLTPGIYPITYSIYGVDEVATVSVSKYRITTHDFALHTSEGYDYAMSFDALEITHPDLSKERKSYEEFIALGGHVETTVPKIQTPGRYETVYSLEGVSEVASILIIEDEIEVEYHLNDIAMFAHQPLNIEETFESVVVTVNGNTETYNTIQEFVDAGGTIDFENSPRFLIDSAIFGGSSGSPVFVFNQGSYSLPNGSVNISSRIKFVGIVYAVAQHAASGEIEIVEVPTSKRQVSNTLIPNNLGVTIHARKLLDFECILEEMI